MTLTFTPAATNGGAQVNIPPDAPSITLLNTVSQGLVGSYTGNPSATATTSDMVQDPFTGQQITQAQFDARYGAAGAAAAASLAMLRGKSATTSQPVTTAQAGLGIGGLILTGLVLWYFIYKGNRG